MHASTLRGFLTHLRCLTDPNRSRELSDADLLERFRLGREEAAFTLLVQRHGPMVLNVCRRILGDAHEAEDVFQAAFLVLARKAASIQRTQSLAAWLHRVACRLAFKARAGSVRRKMRESEVISAAPSGDCLDALASRELRTALDEEIERLPQKYRMPVILCYLSDQTHEQAACALGCPKSSVTSRLARARELLQQRLLRRGFPVPAGLLAILLTEQSANAAMPSLLTLSTVRLAVGALAAERLMASSAATLAGSLAKNTMALKLTATVALLATLGFAAVGYRMVIPSSSFSVGGKQQGADVPRSPQRRKPRLDRFGDPLPQEAIARMGSSRLRHPWYVRGLAFAPDGKSLVSSSDKAVRIWDAATGKLQRHFDVSADWSLSFALTSEGILVASAGYEKKIVTLQVFDPATGKMRRRIELPERTTSDNVTLSRDGKWLAYGREGNILLLDTASGREMLRVPRGNPNAFVPGKNSIAIAADGKSFALCNNSDTVRVYDISSGKCTHRFKHQGERIYAIHVSADGRYLASLPSSERQAPGIIYIWDLRICKEIHRLKSTGYFARSVAFAPDSKYLAAGCTNSHLLLFDVATGKEVRRYPTDAYFAAIAFSPDGKALAATSGTGTIRLWETATGRVLPASADPFLDSVHELRFSSDGRRLLGCAGIYFAWDANSGRELRRFPKVSDRNWRAALSPDESLLAADDDADGTLRLWDTKTGREVRALKGDGNKWVTRRVFSPDGRRLMTANAENGTIRIWNITDGQQIGKLSCAAPVTFLAVSPDGRCLASSTQRRLSDGYEVVLWDLKTKQEKMHVGMTQSEGAWRLAFSPDSRFLAAIGNENRADGSGLIFVRDLTGEREPRTLIGHKGWVRSVAFSPDNRTLATGDQRGEVLLWELASKRRRHRFAGHEFYIKSLAFSPNGRLLASSSSEAPVYVWDVTGATEQTHRPLPAAELQRCWTALAGDDASAAFQAIRRLAAIPDKTLSFIREHLKPASAPNRKHIRQLVEMLDSADFATRQKATEELEKQSDVAAGLLRQILTKEKPSLEVRQRLQPIVEGIENKPEVLRAVRAVEVLEWIATPEAVRLIDELAGGAADARLTREAASAKRRLDR